jgi:hypothetical protein
MLELRLGYDQVKRLNSADNLAQSSLPPDGCLCPRKHILRERETSS